MNIIDKIITKIEQVVIGFGRKYIDFDGFYHIILSVIFLEYAGALWNIRDSIITWVVLCILKEIIDITLRHRQPKESIHDLLCDLGGFIIVCPLYFF